MLFYGKGVNSNMLKKTNIVIFDFDGTLSASDTNYEFFKYCFAHSIRPWIFLPCVLIGIIGRYLNPAGVWWRQTIRNFITPQMIHDFSADFIKHHKKNRFNWVKDTIAMEKRAGNKVVLISASPDYLIPLLVSDIKFDAVLCSKANKKHPWKYDFLCWGKNKVIALDNWAKQNKYIPNVVRAFSDSVSDMPIMEIAKEKVWINPKTGNRK